MTRRFQIKQRPIWLAFLILGCSDAGGPNGPAPPVPPPFPLGSAPRGLLYVVPALSDSAGSAYLADTDGTNPRRLQWVQHISAGYPARDTSIELLPMSGPVFAPDGDRVAFHAMGSSQTGSGNVPLLFQWIADTTGDAHQTRCGGYNRSMALRWAPGISWSPDGKRVAYNCAYPITQLTIDTVTNDSLQFIPVSWNVQGAVAWSPDGHWILDGRQLVGLDSSVVDLTMPAGMTGLGWAQNGWVIVGPDGMCGTGVYWMAPKPAAQPVKLLGPPYRYAAFSPDAKKLLALTGVCSNLDTPRAVVLDRRTLAVEVSIPGATWATWRP